MPRMIQPRNIQELSCNMETAITAFISFCESKNLSPRTIEYYQARILSLSRYIEKLGRQVLPVDMNIVFIRDFLTYEKEHTSPSTANHSLCTLKVFLGFLNEEGYIDSNPALTVKKLKVRKPIIETFSQEQIEALLSTCKKDFYGIRDRAIILMLLDTGIRASELCGLSLDDACMCGCP